MKKKLSMLKIAATCSIGAVLLSGCVNFKFDYAPPTSQPTAKLTITTLMDGHNSRVIYHSNSAPCSAKQAKLIGLLNAVAIGQKNVKQLEIAVPANEEVRISMPQMSIVGMTGGTVTGTITTHRFCQPVVKFIPSANKSYAIEFRSCNGFAYEQGSSIPIGELDRSCKISSEDYLGDNGKIFFLKEKNLGADAQN